MKTPTSKPRGDRRHPPVDLVPNGPVPPAGLSDDASAWWRRLQSEFDIRDPHGLLLLATAMQAFDRRREAAAVLTEHGVVTMDRWGQLRPNPAAVIEASARAALLAALKALGLDAVEPGPVGRPPGSGSRP